MKDVAWVSGVTQAPCFGRTQWDLEAMGPACMRDLLEKGVSQGKKYSHSFIHFFKCSWGRIRQSSPCLWGQPRGLFSAPVSPQRTKKKGLEAQTIA